MTKITINCSCEIYPIKSHVLFTHAAKILHSHNWPDNLLYCYIDESESLFIDLRYTDFGYHVVQTHASDASLNEIMAV